MDERTRLPVFKLLPAISKCYFRAKWNRRFSKMEIVPENFPPHIGKYNFSIAVRVVVLQINHVRCIKCTIRSMGKSQHLYIVYLVGKGGLKSQINK